MQKNFVFGAGVALELAEPDAGDGEVRLRIFSYGTTEYVLNGARQEYYFDEADAGRVVAAYRAGGVDLPVDYNHQQIRAKANGQPAPAAGWITDLAIQPDGLYATIKFTARAAAMIRAKEYRYTSPAFVRGADGHVQKLYNLALTNIPATVGCQPLVAAEQLLPDAAAAADGATPKELMMIDDLPSMLGLSADLDGDALTSAAATKIKELLALSADAAALVATAREVLELPANARLADLAGALTAAGAKLSAAEREAAASKKRDAINRGLAEGRICNAHLATLEKEDLAGAEKIINANPAGTYPPAGRLVAAYSPAAAELTALEKAAASAMGITAEEYVDSKRRLMEDVIYA